VYRVWHLGKQKQDDKLVRLFNNDGGFYVDLYEVNESGRSIGCTPIFSFNIMLGTIVPYTNKRNFTIAENIKLSTVPMYKIWHEPHKAICRLRLQQCDYNIMVIATDNKGKKIIAGNLVQISNAEITPMTSVTSEIKIPKDEYGRLMRLL